MDAKNDLPLVKAVILLSVTKLPARSIAKSDGTNDTLRRRSDNTLPSQGKGAEVEFR